MKPFLKIGALAGGGAGLALALFLEIVGERTIERAVALEAATQPAGATHHEMFSRVTQQIGGGIGAVLYGICLGLIFGVVFAATRHLLRSKTDWRRASVLRFTRALLFQHSVPRARQAPRQAHVPHLLDQFAIWS